MNRFASANTTKFRELTLVKHGLILKYGKKREREILFSELYKIYIKSYTLNPLIQFIVILFPFLFIPLAIDYLPFDIVVFAALFTIIPVFLKVNNYKWCQIKVILKDGTSFRKNVSMHLKSENISIINKVQKEWLHFNFNTNLLASA
jgi:hypothetical protein